MTILVWCSWVCPSGGMERVAAILASGLAVRGHRVLLVGPYSKAPLLQSQIHGNVEYIDYEPRTLVLGALKTANFLQNLVNRYSVDVVSAHGSLFPLMLLGNTPVVWTEHAIRYPHGRMLAAGPRGILWRAIRSKLSAREWEVIGVSRFVLDSVREQLRLEPSIGKVVFNALPQAEMLSSLPAPALKPPYHIGFLGRLEDEKRPMDIFKLKEYVERLGVDCHWHIYGSGSLADPIRAMARSIGNERIHFHGYVNNTVEALEKLDMLVLTSHLEGLPTVVLEARLARRLVVGWRTAGIPEAAGYEGHLIDPPFDLSRFAEGIVKALHAGAPRQPSWEEFAIDTMMVNYESAFAAMLHGRNESSRHTAQLCQLQ